MQRLSIAARRSFLASKRFPSGAATFAAQRQDAGKRLVTAGCFVVAAYGAGKATVVEQAPQEAYAPGQAIGEGLKGDLWKAKHPNVTVLETEDGPFLPLLSYVRNAETTGAAFVTYAERAMRQLLETAFGELPNDEEAEFLTPEGHAVQGVQLEDGVDVLAVTLHVDKERPGMWDRPLRHTFPSASAATVHVTNFQASPVVFKGGNDGAKEGEDGSSDKEPQQCVLLLAGAVASPETVLAALESLAEAGVEEGDVILLSLVMSKPACDKISREAKDLTIITGAVDPYTDGGGLVVPGAGDISARYFEALAESRAAGNAATSDAAPAGSRKRFWLF